MWTSLWPRAEAARAGLVATAAIAAIAAIAQPATAATASSATPVAVAVTELAPDTQLLAMRVNGIDLKQEFEVLALPGGIALPAEAWRATGLAAPAAPPLSVGGRAYYLLEARALKWHVDSPSQTLVIEAPPAAFAATALSMVDGTTVEPVRAAMGGFANVDLVAQSGASGRSAQALLEAGFFGDGLAGRQTALARYRPQGMDALRLDTSVHFERPGAGSSWRLGDGISEPGSWGRALRFAGLQWSTDFSLRPDLQVLAGPSLRGEASLPSSVDVFVDGGRRVQGQIGAGPFTLNELPVVTGQGELRMVVRDLLGREQVSVLPYYASPALLRAGVSAQSVEAGFSRRDYGVASNHYGAGFVSATDRRGLDGGSTRELRAEAGRGLVSAGMGLAWPLPRAFGVAQAGVVGSLAGRRQGALVSAAAEHQARPWSGNVQWRWTSRSFSQLGQPASSAPRSELVLALGSSWLGMGVGTSWVQRSDWQGRSLQVQSANLSWQLGRAGALGLFVVRDSLSRQHMAQVVWSVALDDRQSVSVAVMSDDSGMQGGSRSSMQWQRSAREDDVPSLRLLSERGALGRDEAEAAWTLPWAQLNAGLSRLGGRSDQRFGVATAIAWLGNSAFVSRRIDDSFALVDVADYPGVRVLLDHRQVATTDTHGRALVSGLRGRELNRIAIDPADLPFDAEFSSTDVLVLPPARSGIVVSMPLQRTRAARFRIVDGKGDPLPAGSRMVVHGRSFPIGFDGLAYASGLQAHQRVSVHAAKRSCVVTVALEHADDMLPDLGTLVCE